MSDFKRGEKLLWTADDIGVSRKAVTYIGRGHASGWHVVSDGSPDDIHNRRNATTEELTRAEGDDDA